MTKLVTLKASGGKMIFQDCEADGLQLSEKETWIRLGHSRKNLLYIMGGIVAPSRGIWVP